MQNNISCFEVLENLYKENTEFKNEFKQIIFDIAILKKYITYWQTYDFLTKFRDKILPKQFRGGSKGGFIEDYDSDNKMKEWKSFSAKGTTKFVISLVFQEIKGESEEIKDMLKGEIEDFLQDKDSELNELLLSQEDKDLIRSCFNVVKKYENITKIYNVRYSIFELSSEQLNNMKSYLLQFIMHSQDKNNFDLEYTALEEYLNQKNFLNLLEELTANLINSQNKSEAQKNIMGIMFLLAKVRIGITESSALQTREVTNNKGRKPLLNIPTKMNLNELSEENQKLQKELEVLLEPLLNSRFILDNLYEFYFECRGNLQI